MSMSPISGVPLFANIEGSIPLTPHAQPPQANRAADSASERKEADRVDNRRAALKGRRRDDEDAGGNNRKQDRQRDDGSPLGGKLDIST